MATSESQNPSPSFSSNLESRGQYDIFLSFRGLDTRYDFTDHLYHALLREGYQTFRDDDEIERGEDIKSELLEAIRNSRMSVIVLSENYANSTACLFELQSIIELCKRSVHFVLPVFYKVEPWEVKEQSKNLDFGKKEVTVEKVEGWSAALNEVGSMAGMVFRKESHGYEAKFIEEIVGRLKSKLPGKHLRVDDHLVGMDSRTKRVDMWLKDRSIGVGVLVICGMGGIGKTTIAQVLYNSNLGRYDATCFLPNIRDVAKGPNGLVRLQRQLLSDILRKEERKVNDVYDGCRRMKYILNNKRVLLVLDDVDHRDHIFALAGQRDWFMPGSKIIITTRLESLKNADHEIYVYRPEKLSIDESLELFSWYAFGQKHPIQDHMDVSKRFVHHCDGLPLALEVLGSSVRGKSSDVWESALQKLQATCDSTILEKLEISYDSLKHSHDKNLFLEIACFFAGKKKNDTITILEGCDYSALAGIHNLVDRNLLTIVNEKLGMHQLLQDMGKQIVCRESEYPEKRSRIWQHKDSFIVLSEKIGTNKIKGLMLDMNMNSNMVVFEANTFEKINNLRLLKLSGVRLSGTYRAFPKRLGWLYWRGFPSESFPNDFPLENLVNLDLRYSNLKQVWRGTKALGSLKKLNLSHSPRLAKTPDFSRIPNLEKLILKACPSLFEVDESLVKLQRLESLNLRDCKNLRKLPRNINTVESLVEINISGCSNLMGAIEELEKMKSLRFLHASRMDIGPFLSKEVISQGFNWPWVPKQRIQMSLASLPSSLTHLNLSHCNLTENAFPGDFSKLSKLKKFFLGGNPVSSLPKAIKDLTGLQKLDLSWCPKLQHILFPPIGLEELVVTECRALEKITYEPSASIKTISHGACMSLDYVQRGFKILPVKKVDVELINKIGFFNLESMANLEAFIVNTIVWSRKKCPIQILYDQRPIFSTYFPGSEVPHWFSNRNRGSTLSLTMTSPSPHCGFPGLNLCLVYTLPDNLDWLPLPLEVEVRNKSQMMKWVYTPRYHAIPEAGGDMVWLSHWPPGMTIFEEGDELQVLFNLKVDGQIKECGVHILYFREDEMGKYFSTLYHSWDSNMFRVVALEEATSATEAEAEAETEGEGEGEGEGGGATSEDAEGGGDVVNNGISEKRGKKKQIQNSLALSLSLWTNCDFAHGEGGKAIPCFLSTILTSPTVHWDRPLSASGEIKSDIKMASISAAPARKGKDIQEIPWERLNITREKYRQTRLEQYKNYENIPQSGKGSEKDCKVTMKGGMYYEFRRNSRSVKSTIPHFQLRNLVWATSKHDVYLMSHFSVIHWSALNCNKTEVLNVSGPVAPCEKHPGSLLEGFTQTKVSTLAVKDRLLVAGGFQGELICKNLDRPGVCFCTRTIEDDINAIEIYSTQSGAVHFTAANNDCGVRDFDMEKFQLSKHFSFPWPVNHTSMSPDGKLRIIVGDNPEGMLVDSGTGKMVASLVGHLDFSFASAWHPDGLTFATGNQDKTCRIWDARNLSKSMAALKGNLGAIRSIRYSSDGRFMAMAEPADFVHVFDAKSGYEKEQEIDFFGEISGMSFSPDTESLFIGVCDDFEVRAAVRSWDRTYGGLLEFGRRRNNSCPDSIF